MKIDHLKKYRHNLQKYAFVLYSNIFFSGLLAALATYLKIARIQNSPDQEQRLRILEAIFEDPFTSKEPYIGIFTSLSELLWYASVSMCLLSFLLLKKLNQNYRLASQFILQIGILLFLLLIDDVFRLTLILHAAIDLPKFIMYMVYATWGAYITLRFRTYIVTSTPYGLPLISIGLFLISAAVDSVQLPGRGSLILLEDGTKLLGLINITAYVWFVCQKNVTQALEKLKTPA